MKREPFAMIPFSLLECCQDFNALHLYAWLRRHGNREGVTSADSRRLAREMGASQRSFERALAKLRTVGFVKTTRRHRADGSVVGLTFTVFETRQTARFGVMNQTATSDGKAAHHPASFRPTKVPDLAESKEIDLPYVDLNDLKAGAPAPPPCGKRRNDAPTEAQIWALLTSITDAEGFTGSGELNQTLRAHAAQLPGFDYAGDIDLVNRVVNKFVAAHDRGAVRGARR